MKKLDQVHRWMPGLLDPLSFVLRPLCLHCQRSTRDALCPDCRRKFQSCQRSTHRCAGESILSKGLGHLPPLYVWGDYRGLLKQGLLQLKYDGQAQWATVMGQALAAMWLELAAPPPIQGVVPIPLHRDRETQRGYNQAALIAQRFCQITGLRLYRHGLLRQKSTTAQFGLSAQARQHNLDHAFCLGPDLKSSHAAPTLLLLDDIFTTGITMSSALKVLQQSGAQVAALTTVAIAQSDRDRT
jgi:ComF family protein